MRCPFVQRSILTKSNCSISHLHTNQSCHPQTRNGAKFKSDVQPETPYKSEKILRKQHHVKGITGFHFLSIFKFTYQFSSKHTLNPGKHLPKPIKDNKKLQAKADLLYFTLQKTAINGSILILIEGETIYRELTSCFYLRQKENKQYIYFSI